jgi:hypothetical protein
MVEKDKSPERKANLSQLDAQFARVIGRVQQQVEIGFEQIAKRHLALMGFPASLVKDIKVVLPEASDTFMKRKMEIDLQKAQVVQAVIGLSLFPKKTIYKEFYDMTEQQIEHTMDEMEQEKEEEQANELEQQGAEAQQQMTTQQQGMDQEADREENSKAADHERDKELQKESIDTRIVDTLSRLKKRVIQASGNKSAKLASIERIIARNVENPQRSE